MNIYTNWPKDSLDFIHFLSTFSLRMIIVFPSCGSSAAHQGLGEGWGSWNGQCYRHRCGSWWVVAGLEQGSCRWLGMQIPPALNCCWMSRPDLIRFWMCVHVHPYLWDDLMSHQPSGPPQAMTFWHHTLPHSLRWWTDPSAELWQAEPFSNPPHPSPPEVLLPAWSHPSLAIPFS